MRMQRVSRLLALNSQGMPLYGLKTFRSKGLEMEERDKLLGET